MQPKNQCQKISKTFRKSMECLESKNRQAACYLT